MKEPKDLRSTGRKRLRAALMKEVNEGIRIFQCECIRNCPGHVNKNPCAWKPVGTINRANNLDANHLSKDLNDCDPSNGEFLCRSCHKLADNVTAKNVTTVEDQFGYNQLFNND